MLNKRWITLYLWYIVVPLPQKRFFERFWRIFSSPFTVPNNTDLKDDGSENVAKKMNLPSFKLHRIYLDPLNMSNAGDFSWSWIVKDFIQVQKEEGKFVVVCPRPP